MRMANQTAPATVTPPVPDHDPMPLNGIDHVELYVGNALQAAYFYAHALGFQRIAYRGLETGDRDAGLPRPAPGPHPPGAHRRAGLRLPHRRPPAQARRRREDDRAERPRRRPRLPRGHEPRRRGRHRAPRHLDEHGTVRTASIRTYGETLHTFVQRDGYAGAFLPGFRPVDDTTEDSGMLLAIDHIVGNVELGAMDTWVKYYEDVFGMTEMIHFSDDDIGTEYSALMSKVVSDGKGLVKFPINEPAEGKRKSQIDEYLDFYEGAGAQHIAVATRDIVGTVAEMRRRGVEFITIPPAYYEDVVVRVPEVEGQLADLKEQGILVDRDDQGYLLQIFTQPTGDRPTLFLEVIERHGARGFGDGNFKALFEAIEREQEKRGNL